ncbi:hypothetical protein [Brevundimonas sp. M20]|uniref:hypothetical protein n=1 Tax=Brevundimonas sp. M20 TaxID=2591463 RepID=UPI0011461D0F|nr:hypothetical protein [Brevundimonas sp. M20]QDH72667.1 hypothetical protein FKQ52_04000 [Brevundimonas sp. M20]
MSRYTRLEQAVMAALAHDLRADVPDLAGQFEESRPSQRRNSGFGLFTEMIVDRNRPPPASGPTGDLGSVHAMVGALPDPVAFKARLRNGVLLGLMGDSYGQDTRAIDFATIPFDQIFTVNAAGVSVPFEPARHMPPSPLRDLQRHSDHVPASRSADPPPLKNVGALQRVQEVNAPPPHRRTATPQDIPIPPDQTGLLVGLWVLIGVIAVIGALVLRLPLPLAIFFALIAGRTVKDPKVFARVRTIIDGWSAASVKAKD